MPLVLHALHPDATFAIGHALASVLVAGDVVVLTGPLGAGKTRLVQGLAAGLDVPGRVTSPTFVLVRRHTGRVALVHVDAYRLDDASDLVTLDDDVLADDVITCIEWGGNVVDALPEDRLDIGITVDGDHGDAPRTVAIAAQGRGWDGRAEALRVTLTTLVAVTPALESTAGTA
jgi:tRNA threonylcarbamoyladenosine biosynthesis protein TsaE